MIVEPAPALAPVMPPVIVPIVQVNVLTPGVLAVNAIFVAVPLHIVAVAGVVTTGAGLTVTVIVNGAPVQPNADVGVTIYCTVPGFTLLGLVNVCAIVVPQAAAHAVAPVIPPVIVPIVQVNVLAPGVLVVNAIAVAVPLQIVAVGAVVTTGEGLTVTVIVNTGPVQPNAETGVTRNCTEPADTLLGLTKF